MNCSLADAYHGKYRDYWEYEFDNNSPIARIFVNFYGVEDYSAGLGLIYNQSDGLRMGGAAIDDVLHDDTTANVIRLNGQLVDENFEPINADPNNNWTIDMGIEGYGAETARIAVEASGENYVWTVTNGAVLSVDGNDNLATITALSDLDSGMNGTTVSVNYTRANGDEVEFEWKVCVRGPAQSSGGMWG